MLNILCVTYFVTTSLVVFEAASHKKRENMEVNFFYINLHLRDPLDIEFTACYGELMSEEAPTSFTISDAYRNCVWVRHRPSYCCQKHTLIRRINRISLTGFNTINTISYHLVATTSGSLFGRPCR